MLIPPIDNDSNKYFEVNENLNKSLNLKHLSMGMSADYIDAINHGATFVRVGSSCILELDLNFDIDFLIFFKILKKSFFF